MRSCGRDVRRWLRRARTADALGRKLLWLRPAVRMNGKELSEVWKGRRMDRLEAMSAIVAVAEAGSISAASRRLKSPVATLSRKVAELESHLKVQLFQRTSRQMTLTEAGRAC